MGGPLISFWPIYFRRYHGNQSRLERENTQIPTSNIHPFLSSSWQELFRFECVWEKWERCRRSEARWSHLSPPHSPSEAALYGQWAQQKDDFRTSVSPTWTLFIALKKALPYHWSCKANAQKRHLCKPYYSHLWTEGAVRDAGRGCWKRDRLWNANCLLCASSEQKDPQSMFHAKQMIPFHKDNPDIPKWFFFFLLKWEEVVYYKVWEY